MSSLAKKNIVSGSLTFLTELLHKWVLAGFILTVVFGLTGSVLAQDEGAPGPELVVPLNGGEVFRTGSSISRVVTGDSGTVNVKVISDQEIMLFGVQEGATTLHVWTDRGLVQRLLLVEQVSSQSVGQNFRSVLSDNEDLDGDVEMRVFTPQHRGVSEFEGYITNLLGEDGEILLADGPSRKIFVAGKPEILDKINQLMDRLDVPTEDKIYSNRYVLDNRPVTQIDTQVQSMLSEKGTTVSDRETNSLLIVDKVSNVESIQSYLEEIDVPTVKQVRIQTRFVEISEDLTHSLGIDWSANDLSGSPQSRASFTDDGNVDATNIPRASGFELGLIDNAAGDFSISSRLNALESESALDLISSPSLVTRNQQEAVLEILNQISFLEGCQVTQNEGGGSQATPQIGSVEDGITMSVTPLIGASDIVQLRIKPVLKLVDFSSRVGSVSTACGPIEFPEVDRRTANLNVALKDGQTLVLGGLSRSEESPSYTRVPYLSQIPLMGYLFQSRTEESEQKEINIFVTVDIIEFQDPSETGDTVGIYPDEASREAQKTIESDTPLF